MKTALPNWICAVCLIIIAALFVGWTIYGALAVHEWNELGRRMEADVAKSRESFSSPYRPQPSDKSSEWGN